jgi:hypothetical protein
MVHAGSITVRVVGTEFGVERRNQFVDQLTIDLGHIAEANNGAISFPWFFGSVYALLFLWSVAKLLNP